VEPFEFASHASALARSFLDRRQDEDWTYLPYGPFKGSDELVAWLHSNCQEIDPQFHVILEGAGNSASGLASYLNIRPESRVIEIGHIHFAPPLQRTPAATEAIYLFLSRAFDELGYRRVEWKCDALNERSRRAATRLGFHFEGVFRQATIYKGRNRDTAWYSMIDLEWPGVKAALEAWLLPENFDSEHRQIASLSALAGYR